MIALSFARLRYLGPAVAVFVCAVGISELAIRYRETQLDKELRGLTTQYLSALRARIEGTFNSSIYLTNALNALVASQGKLSQEDFGSIALALTVNSRHIRNVGLAEGFVITRIYPIEGNEKALGFDYRSNAAQWPAVKRALEQRETVVAGPLALIEGGLAIVIRAPIYVPDPEKPGHQVYWGLSSVVIDFDTILREAGLPNPASNYEVAIRGRNGLGAAGEVFWGDPALFQMHPVTMPVSFPNGNWQLAALPRDDQYHAFDWIILRVGGISIALLVATLTLVRALDSQKLRHMALHDPLTGLPNRTFFDRQLEQTIMGARRHQRMFALAVLDLNEFKPVNDRYGHLAGDLVLAEVAQRIGNRIRQEDTVARTGGDEFTLLLTDIQKAGDAVGVVEDLTEAIRQPFGWRGSKITIGCSVGIALYPEHGRNQDALFTNADHAMYQAKEAADCDWALATSWGTTP